MFFFVVGICVHCKEPSKVAFFLSHEMRVPQPEPTRISRISNKAFCQCPYVYTCGILAISRLY